MSSFKILLPILAISLFLFACREDEPIDDSEGLLFQLNCQTIDANANPPIYAVYVVVNYNKVKIASSTACDSISKQDYEKYNIPDNAFEAVGGWHKEEGTVIYAAFEGQYLSFFQKHLHEASDGSIKELKTLQLGKYIDGKFDLRLPLRMEDLPGAYVLSKESGSHLIFVGLKDNGLAAEYFQTEETLPPVDQLNLLMATMEPDTMNNFEVQFPSLQFISDTYSGEFIETENGGIDLILTGEEALKLHKIQPGDDNISTE